MKEEFRRLQKLKSYILGIEMRLEFLMKDLESISQNIGHFTRLKKDLEENIKILKSNGIVTLASEYKRSVNELERAKQQIEIFLISEKQLHKELLNQNIEKEQALQTLGETVKTIEGKKVILLFDKKRKKGKGK